MASKKQKKEVKKLTSKRASRVSKKFSSPGITEQHHRDEVDTSKLVSRWMQTGIPPTHQRKDGWYGVVPALDFHMAKNTVARAEQSFNQLPAVVRAQFNNDPQSFLAFAGDEENTDELIEMLGPIPDDLEEEEEGSYDEPENEEKNEEEPQDEAQAQ